MCVLVSVTQLIISMSCCVYKSMLMYITIITTISISLQPRRLIVLLPWPSVPRAAVLGACIPATDLQQTLQGVQEVELDTY